MPHRDDENSILFRPVHYAVRIPPERHASVRKPVRSTCFRVFADKRDGRPELFSELLRATFGALAVERGSLLRFHYRRGEPPERLQPKRAWKRATTSSWSRARN